MESEILTALAELGSTGLLLVLLMMERKRSTTIQEARIADLKTRISYLESLLPPTLAQYASAKQEGGLS